MSFDAPCLQVNDLHFAQPGRPLWAGWSAAWGAGVHALVGGDGAGKTTLLELLAGQLRPQRGAVLLRTTEAEASCGPAGRSDARVFWTDPRRPDLPPPENLSPAQWLATLPARYPHWQADALAAHVDGWALAPHLDKPFHALSTGTQRKVFMAAALASGAPLTLIDEPVGGLDKPSIAYLQQALAALAAMPERVLIVAHYEALPGVDWHSVVHLPD